VEEKRRTSIRDSKIKKIIAGIQKDTAISNEENRERETFNLKIEEEQDIHPMH
jgi:hypothetical protein